MTVFVPAFEVKSDVGEGKVTLFDSFSYLSLSGTVYSVTVYVLPFEVEVGRSFTVKVPFVSVFLMVLNFVASLTEVTYFEKTYPVPALFLSA